VQGPGPLGRVALLFLLALGLGVPATVGAGGPPVEFKRAKHELSTFAHMTCRPGCTSRVYQCRRRSPRRVDCHARTHKVERGIVEPEHEFAVERTTCDWIGYATPSDDPQAGYFLDVERFRCLTRREFPRRPDGLRG
jgi:hypothetical protein